MDDSRPGGTRAFQHWHAAHCESGVVSTMLRNHGLPMSEAMAFGLASGLSFAYIPLVKINEMPLIAYRMPPRFIIKRLRKRLALPFRFETFSSPQDGERRLDELLAQGRHVGVQTSVFFLPYFPDGMRFHFNAHNLIVFGKDGGEYLVSDPVFEQTKRCAAPDLARARFARGALAPKGMLYYLDGPLGATDLRAALPGAILSTCRTMLQWIFPFAGVGGIRMFARSLLTVSARKAEPYARRYAGHIVRMQEEIGTGGAGFRFLYAAFLQEASRLLDRPALDDAARDMSAIGDAWREFALDAARMSRGRRALDPPLLNRHLNLLADREAALFSRLKSEFRVHAP